MNKLLTSIICSTALFCSCTSTGASDPEAASTDTLYSPSHAGGFLILRADTAGSSIIEVYNPWQGAADVTERLYIDRTPDGTLDVPAGSQIIKGDAKRLVLMSSTAVAMLDAIGANDRIVGVSGGQYISSPTLKARAAFVAEVGWEGNIDYETLLSLKPDLVVVYGVGGPSAMTGKLAEAGIPVFYLGDYLEESPLGKAEWMVAMGEITGQRESAVSRFNAIVPEYETIAARARAIERPRPRVMLNTPYGDSWFMPGHGSYMSRLVADAGGEYVYADAPDDASTATIDMETAYRLAASADVWLNVGDYPTLASLSRALPKLADIPAVKTVQVFSNTARSTPGGGNDFYESGVVNPHLVLRDLVKIFHPDSVPEEFVYYRQLK